MTSNKCSTVFSIKFPRKPHPPTPTHTGLNLLLCHYYIWGHLDSKNQRTNQNVDSHLDSHLETWTAWEQLLLIYIHFLYLYLETKNSMLLLFSAGLWLARLPKVGNLYIVFILQLDWFSLCGWPWLCSCSLWTISRGMASHPILLLWIHPCSRTLSTWNSPVMMIFELFIHHQVLYLILTLVIVSNMLWYNKF